MYQYPPVLLPPISDREDYVLTLALFDDATLQPVDFSGITLLNTGSNFTGSSWQVNAGNVVTNSSTTITIPAFPVTGTNNLTALTLTVAPNLAITPGNPVTIIDPTGNNQVTGFTVSYAPTTGSLQVQIGWTFEFEVRRRGPHHMLNQQYVPWYDFGAGFDAPLLSANFTNGYLGLADKNVVQINIPASVVRTIGGHDLFSASGAPNTYLTNMVGTDSVNTRQLLFATTPIQYGGVR
jgi:hypothetical protein